MTDPKSTAAYAELVKRRAELDSEKQALLTQYKPKHPDVIAVQSQIDSVQRQMDEMVEEHKRKVEEQRKRMEARVDPRLTSYKGENDRLSGEVKRQQSLLDKTEADFACGVLLAAVVELPRLLTVQTAEDAEHYTGLPVLVTLPMLLTPREERNQKARRAALAVAAVVATIVSAPALAFVLSRLHLIEMLANRDRKSVV